MQQTEYNERLKQAAGLMEAALRRMADLTDDTAEQLRLMDATPDQLRPVRAGGAALMGVQRSSYRNRKTTSVTFVDQDSRRAARGHVEPDHRTKAGCRTVRPK
jgi:hypothetical protein